MKRALLGFLLVASMSSATSALAGVIVVDDDGGPGVDATNITAALALAAPGDVILVKGGTYPAFAASAMPLTIAADAGAAVSVIGGFQYPAVAVVNIAAGQRFVMRGLRIQGGGAPVLFDAAVRLSNNAGVVWIEDCVVTNSQIGVRVEASSVVLERCTLAGIDHGAAPSVPALTPGGDGLAVLSGSNVTLMHCTLTGGIGRDALCVGAASCYSGAGGAGAFVMDSSALLAVASNFTGGAGGAAFPGFACQPASAGGPGLWLSDGAPVVRESGCAFVGGAGGSAALPCTPGAPGTATLVSAGLLTSLPGTARSFDLDSPVREAQNVSLQFAGPGGEQVFLLAGLAPANVLALGHSGALFVGGTIAVIPAGTMPPAQSFALTVNVGHLPPAVESLEVFAQAVFIDGTGRAWLADGSVIDVLDSQF